jgi:hypothetical protein
VPQCQNASLSHSSALMTNMLATIAAAVGSVLLLAGQSSSSSGGGGGGGGGDGSATTTSWSWDTMRSMLFYHSGNESGLYSGEAIAKVSSYSVVTMEKFNGEKWTGAGRPPSLKYDEDLMTQELRRVDAAHPSNESTVLIFYMNAWKAKELSGKSSRMYEQFMAHPEWQLFHDVGGGTCGDKKTGCAWDVSLPEVRHWWIETCVNATRAVRPSGHNVGCYADASNTYPVDPEHEKTPNDAALLWPTLAHTNAATLAKAEAWTQGLLNMTTEAQRALGPGGWIMGKTANQPGVRALQIEGFAASNSSITAMREGVRRGKLVEGHIGMGGSSGGQAHPGCLVRADAPGGQAAQAQMMEDHLATFLIAAGPNCYIGCGQWKFEGASDLGEYGSGLEFIDNAWVDRQLGPPQSDGMYDAATKTWHRRFRSGTNVSFDVGSNTGHIEWAAGPAPPPPPGPSPPPSPSPSPAPPHPASACARELAAHCNASAGKIACEACCKAEIKALQKRSGLLCTKADRDALCKKHKKHKTDDDDAAAAAAAAAPPRPKKYNIIHLNTV